MFFSHRRGQSWLTCFPLFTQRLREFGLIGAIQNIWTLSISHYIYNEWWEKAEIGTHSPQPSPYPGFWLAGGDNYGRNPPTFHTKIVCFGLIQESQCILTLPMSQYKYNEWLEEVEIVVWALKWSPHACFSHDWAQIWLDPFSLFQTEVECLSTNLSPSQHLNPSNLSLLV